MVTKTLIFLTILALTNGLRSKYGFYRYMELENNGPQSRRIFGGVTANLSDYPTAAALLDRYWSTRCSGAVISPFWVITAAHCVTIRVAYIKYNSNHPHAPDGDTTPVLYLYRHPGYQVLQEDQGQGMDVTLLHHDIGLIRTRDEMKLKGGIPPLSELKKYNPSDLEKKELTILGFGRTELHTRGPGEELIAVKLQMVFCDRGSWFHCLCGTAFPGGEQRGVCSGDSGGPVMYRNVQVGITSMGPLECATPRSDISVGATSVFTATFHYFDLINATINEADTKISLRKPHKALPSKKHTGRSGSILLRIYVPVVIFSVFAIFL